MSDITKPCRDIQELSPLAQIACNLFRDECKKVGLIVCITETYRPQQRQNWLYEQGRTRAGNVVTWTKNSRHTSRMAWDICKNVKGQEYSDSAFFSKCGEIAKRLGITWGGTWSTPDKPHFEINKSWKAPVMEDDEVVEKDKLIVNGKEFTVELIRKDGTTYIKTRDIAEVLGLKVGSKGKIPVINR
ncbi:M15 family metallopeptidase [Anaerotignum propionicum]|uniref:Peptidoglycan L-alanyl-D-glutamate endopeptidase CwlK n=1 Tax=Anaerotignum propionicum DSM 1682 TaxID=991789 RepID=A0A0X8VE59_ANAPI|nr:M15 family metallopeptidase [Anaerotignum propionicum]AMJ42339.1 peptidoglycan L-alanyl-D-glutamate endopeptidase CwlK precursor [Anaerotignum propionicum DSM 1682]SHE99895.1 peptidoglycan L-alanyl-D-glutamate endopeptidase CwlK [[Clostridium] propionicum DSM 1682] [Anaerotignum propionicum DSM 1682]